MELDSILSPVQGDLTHFDEKLRLNLNSYSRLISQVAGHLVNRKGKRLRPAMVFLSYGLCKGTDSESPKPDAGLVSNHQVMNVALAVELIHTATLLHDDVVDQSKVRRGQVSVNHKWSNLVSVLMGDFLLAKALRLLVETESPALLSTISKATVNLSVGEMSEAQETHNFDLDEKTYLEIISAKTASLFTASCEAGAVAAGADRKNQKMLREYGQNLGMAFQITDDLLDWVGETEKTGKGLGTDLKEGKITLPLIHTLKECDPSTRKKIIRLLENDFNQKGFTLILSLMKGNGGVDYARKKAGAFGRKALTCVSEFTDSEHKRALQDLISFVIKREK
ncbi:MAG: polyprenyl synthetase family protein [Candidatus Zixiibacteriota bacterium]